MLCCTPHRVISEHVISDRIIQTLDNIITDSDFTSILDTRETNLHHKAKNNMENLGSRCFQNICFLSIILLTFQLFWINKCFSTQPRPLMYLIISLQVQTSNLAQRYCLIKCNNYIGIPTAEIRQSYNCLMTMGIPTETKYLYTESMART